MDDPTKPLLTYELDPKSILPAYRTISRVDPEPSSLLVLARRYNLTWFGPACLSQGITPVEVRQPGLQPVTKHPVLCYKSVLRGDEGNPILHRVRKLAALPQFYRLNWIRQLSTTSLAINLDGNHNRLAHSLGTLDVASRFVSVLQDHLKPVEIKAILVYAFIHDCFHGPMGHTMDLIRDVIWGREAEERVDKHLLLLQIQKGLKKQGFLWAAVRENVADNDDECRSILEHIKHFLTAASKGKTFMSEIVDSDLDADRLDYIWRDHIHLMMGGFDVSQRQIEDLIESVRVIKEEGASHLAFSVEHAEIVEQILDIRVRLYTRFYEHPIKIVADEMLTHAVYYVLEEEGVLAPTGELSPSQRDFAEQFSYLTDDGLFHFLTELTSKDAHVISYGLLQDLLADRPFEIVDQKGLKRDNFFFLMRRYYALDHALEAIQRTENESISAYLTKRRTLGIFDRDRYDAIIARYNEVAFRPIRITDTDPIAQQDPKWKGTLLPYTEEDDIYRIQFLYGGSFRKKSLLERLLWRELQAHEPAFDEALGRLVLALAGSRSSETEYTQRLLEKVRRTPLIFISLSWIPGVTEQELRNHQRGFSPISLRFHENGKPFRMEAELTVRPRDVDYLLSICAPRVLLYRDGEDVGMKDVIAKRFEAFLRGHTWIFPDELEKERTGA